MYLWSFGDLGFVFRDELGWFERDLVSVLRIERNLRTFLGFDLNSLFVSYLNCGIIFPLYGFVGILGVFPLTYQVGSSEIW